MRGLVHGDSLSHFNHRHILEEGRQVIGNLYAHQAAAYNHTAVAGIGRPVSTSWPRTTLAFSTPGIFFGTMGVTPVAAITTSGFSASTISLVTVVFRITGTFSFFSSFTCQHRKLAISPFPGGMEAILYCPPAQRSLS